VCVEGGWTKFQNFFAKFREKKKNGEIASKFPEFSAKMMGGD